MNRSKIIAAALLAFAPLSAFAAPSGEEALSAVFTAQRDGLRAALSDALAESAAVPASAPAPVSPAHWQELVAKVRASGTFTPSDGNMPATYGLADVRGPADAAHVSNYINEWGYTDSRGEFQAGEVTLVSEYWSIPADGNWHIDQWIFRLGMDGSVGARAHIVLVETRDGQVLGDDAEQLKDGDPRIAAKYDALLNLWNGFTPKPKAEKSSEILPLNALTGPTAFRFAK